MTYRKKVTALMSVLAFSLIALAGCGGASAIGAGDKDNSLPAAIQKPVYSSDSDDKKKVDDVEYSNGNSLTSYEVSLRNGEKKDVSINSGELFLFTDGGSTFKLNQDQKADLSFKINLSADYSDKDKGEPVVVGYVLDGKSTVLYSGKTGTDALGYEFVAPKAGEYSFYLGNVSVGMQNYDSVSVIKREQD
ncbi:hypothetical protein FACS1894133_0530 [Clostridia bacterium]|nr:hypothetical protein FACS1894133_0260 [Clostridia bacterium]GHU57523.1 hypothetical protein FACS1894133_0530 [Clostridia bacterium]